MRIEKMEIKIYNYEDLLKEENENLKEKILNNFREENHDYYFLASDILEFYTGELENLGYNNTKIYYSGFWSQGDGACFICDSIDIEKIIDRMNLKVRLNLKNYLIDNFGALLQHRGLYYHYNSVNLNYSSYFRGAGEKTENYLNNLVEEITDFIEDERKNYCYKIYNSLKQQYEECQSDEYILESIYVNGYEFTEDGAII